MGELDAPKVEGEKSELSLFEDRVGQLAIKNLILCDVEDSKGGLAQAFLGELKDRLMDVAESNRGAFVVASLCKVPSKGRGSEEARQKDGQAQGIGRQRQGKRGIQG